MTLLLGFRVVARPSHLCGRWEQQAPRAIIAGFLPPSADYSRTLNGQSQINYCTIPRKAGQGAGALSVSKIPRMVFAVMILRRFTRLTVLIENLLNGMLV